MIKPKRTNDTTASVVPTYARSPQRISVTLSWQVHQQLIERSDSEGRSLSNLAAHLLEMGIAPARTAAVALQR